MIFTLLGLIRDAVLNVYCRFSSRLFRSSSLVKPSCLQLGGILECSSAFDLLRWLYEAFSALLLRNFMYESDKIVYRRLCGLQMHDQPAAVNTKRFRELCSPP